MDDDKIKRLPVKFKHQGKTGKTLEAVKDYQCPHERFIVDESKAEVECAQCGERMNPMFVLYKLAREETHWLHAHDRYHEEMERLSKRSRTRCMHCGQMTRISRK